MPGGVLQESDRKSPLDRLVHTLLWEAAPPLAEFLGAPALRLLGRSWKLSIGGVHHQKAAHEHGSVIYATWHGNLSSYIHTLRDRGIVALVSPVWEGEMIARVLHGLGYDLVRGSSGHQPSEGLRASVRVLQQGGVIGSVVDGPVGPARIVKQGVIAMAQLTGAPILPALSVGSPAWVWPFWDRHELPLPFANVLFRFGEPLTVPRRASASELEGYRLELQNRLLALDEEIRRDLPGAHPQRPLDIETAP